MNLIASTVAVTFVGLLVHRVVWRYYMHQAGDWVMATLWSLGIMCLQMMAAALYAEWHFGFEMQVHSVEHFQAGLSLFCVYLFTFSIGAFTLWRKCVD